MILNGFLLLHSHRNGNFYKMTLIPETMALKKVVDLIKSHTNIFDYDERIFDSGHKQIYIKLKI